MKLQLLKCKASPLEVVFFLEFVLNIVWSDLPKAVAGVYFWVAIAISPILLATLDFAAEDGGKDGYNHGGQVLGQFHGLRRGYVS